MSDINEDRATLADWKRRAEMQFASAQTLAVALAAAGAEIEALKHDLSRHLSITSEQATEILGKEKEIADLRKRNDAAGSVCNNILELVQPTQGGDELAFARAMAVRGATEYATLLDGYAVLEKKNAALEQQISVLLQLKGK